MILITGASGAIGGRAATLLSARGLQTRLLVRDAARAPKLPGSNVAVGSYEDAASLDVAMRGVSCAFIVSGTGEPVKRSRLHASAMDAAVRAGVGHVVYLSFQGAAMTSKFPYAVDHALSEAHLRTLGVPFTILRDSLYIDNIPHLFGVDGVVRGPAGNGRTAWVGRDDVAEVLVAVLADPAVYAGRTLEVTGPEAVGYADVAARLSTLTGKPLRYEDESIETARTWRTAGGAEAWEVEVWMGSYLAAAAGELAPVSDTVENVTGHPPLGMTAYFEKHAELLASFA